MLNKLFNTAKERLMKSAETISKSAKTYVKNARVGVDKKYKKVSSDFSAATKRGESKLGVNVTEKVAKIPEAVRLLSGKQKIVIGIVGLMLANRVLRETYTSFSMSSQNTPPPAYQGTYGAIEGMRHTNPRRPFNSDFGSGLKLNRVANRKIMPQRHTQW